MPTLIHRYETSVFPDISISDTSISDGARIRSKFGIEGKKISAKYRISCSNGPVLLNFRKLLRTSDFVNADKAAMKFCFSSGY